jgi:hypothetical protein
LLKQKRPQVSTIMAQAISQCCAAFMLDPSYNLNARPG